MPSDIDVIIIEDQAAVTEVITLYLEEMHLFKKIVHAEDGIIASFKLKNQSFDVVFLDINLPKKTGIDIIMQNSDDPEMMKKIILMSGAMEKKHLEKALRAGVKNVLLKPFTKDQLQAMVSQVLDSQKSKKNIA